MTAMVSRSCVGLITMALARSCNPARTGPNTMMHAAVAARRSDRQCAAFGY